MTEDLKLGEDNNFIRTKTTDTTIKTEPVTKPIGYLAARYMEIICIGLFIFGFLWNGTEVMNLATPQFLMLYGGSGAVICEVLARLFSKKKRTGE